MGANATTFVPAYVSGEVLTAADLTVTNSGIPVFADATARNAAFGGTGEKVLAEGQYAYLEDTNATLLYDGSNWVSVGTTPGLVCVKAETTVTAASSATGDGIFTSNYTNYILLLNYTTSSTQPLQLKLRTGGVSASTNYTFQTLQGFGASVTTDAFASQTAIVMGYYGNTASQYSVVQIGNPQLAKATSFATQNPAIGGALNYYIQGIHTTATAYDGIELLTATGNWTGTYAVYGFSKVV